MGAPLSAIDEAAEAVARGCVVVVPTDTVYGLAADAGNANAVDRIFALKGRPSDKALQLLVPAADWLERLGTPSNDARLLARRYWPGPLTIIVPASAQAPDSMTSEGTVGLRVPAHPLTIELLHRTGPLAATSANRSGEVTPHDVASIRPLFGDGVDVYVDGGRIEGTASTVVDATGSEIVIVREGAVPASEIMREIMCALEFGFEAG